jgi:hypothetical protein
MKRDNDCKGCSWNFGKYGFPCVYCKAHDLYIEFPYHPSEDTEIQKIVIGIISAVIYIAVGYALGISLESIKNASIQEEDN